MTTLSLSPEERLIVLAARIDQEPAERLESEAILDRDLNIFFPAPYDERRMDEVWKETWTVETNGHRLRGLAPEDQG